MARKDDEGSDTANNIQPDVYVMRF